MNIRDQFEYSRLDGRQSYTTRLRLERINQSVNPELAKTIEQVDHASRIFCVRSIEELNLITAEYENHFEPGHLAILPDLVSGSTRMFVWVNDSAMWQEIILGGGTSTATGLSVKEIKNNVQVAEKGAVIHALKITWDLNFAPVAQTLSPIGDIDFAARSYMKTDLNIYEDTEFKLTAVDLSGSAEATTSVLFRNKIFYGVSSNTSITESNLLAFNNVLRKDIFFDASFDCNDQYIYYAIPKDMGAPQFIVYELINNDWEKSSLSLINKHGQVVDYDIYRSKNKIDSKNIMISIF